MSFQPQEEDNQDQKSKILYFQQKYSSESIKNRQRSLSPNNKQATPLVQIPSKNRVHQIQDRRIQSSSTQFTGQKKKIKAISQSSIKSLYGNEQQTSTGSLFYGQNRPNTFNQQREFLPALSQSQTVQSLKINSVSTNLAQIKEVDNDDLAQSFVVQNNQLDRKLEKQAAILAKENQELKKKCEQQKQAINQLQNENAKLSDQNMVDQFQYFLGPQHHCHYEEQVKSLTLKKSQNEELLTRTSTELTKVIGMVKTYNNDGLMTKILELEQLLKDLEQEKLNMREEIEMLGLQRDDWQTRQITNIKQLKRYQEIQNKFMQIKGTEEKLLETEKKLKMQSDALEKMNRRLKEKQIEVQDWQRKCLNHDAENNKKITKLEQLIKEIQAKHDSATATLQDFEQEIKSLEFELQTKNEALEEEKRKSKQLHTEIVDMRVNKIASMQEEITRQKKIISSRVEEIEMLEQKIKQLNMKIDLLETQLKNFEDVANQKLADKEHEWSKKLKETERQYFQVKRELSNLQIQFQENELMFQQKVLELDEAYLKINNLEEDIQQLQNVEKQLRGDISLLNNTIAQKDNTIAIQSDQIQGFEEVMKKLDEELLKKNQEIQEKKQTILQQQNQLDQNASQISSFERSVSTLQAQVDSAKLTIQAEQEKLLVEHQKLESEVEQNQKHVETISSLKKSVDKEQKEKVLLQGKINDQEKKIGELNKKIIEIQEKDEHQNAKIKQQVEVLTGQLEEEKLKYSQLQDKFKQLTQQQKETQDRFEKAQENLNQTQKQFQDVDKREKSLIEEKTKLLQQNQQLKQIEADYNKAKLQLQELEKLQKEHQQTKILLAVKISEHESQKVKFEQLEIQFSQLKQSSSDEIARLQQQIDYQTKQNLAYKKQLKSSQSELQETQHKLEMLMEALEGMSEDQRHKVITNMARNQDAPKANNSFKQIFVEDKQFEKKEDLLEYRFEDLFLQNNAAYNHLSIAFWLKVKPSNLVELLPIMKITASKAKIVEFGVNMTNGCLYATYFPTSLKKSPPLTVTTQLSLKFNQFAFASLILNDSDGNMDLGLCLNGIRDDQVSVQSTALFPEAVLTIGTLIDEKTNKSVSSLYSIKDAVLITQKLNNVNIFNEVYKQFNPHYNVSKKKGKVVGVVKDQLPYSSTGDFIATLLQQQQIGKPHQEVKEQHRSPKRGVEQEVQPAPYNAHKPVKYRGRMMPAILIDQCDLLNEQNEQIRIQEELKRKQISDLNNVQEEEQLIQQLDSGEWSRAKVIFKLKEFFKENFSVKMILRPIVQHYQFISQSLQLISLPFNDETPATPFHSQYSKLVSKIKILKSPFYIIKMDTLYNYLQKCGFGKISKEILVAIAQLMEISIEVDSQMYIHYDHLLVCLRETVINKAEAAYIKYEEKKALEEIFKKQMGTESEEVSPQKEHAENQILRTTKQYIIGNEQFNESEAKDISQQEQLEVIRSMAIVSKGNKRWLRIVYDSHCNDIQFNIANEEEAKEEGVELVKEKELIVSNLKELEFEFQGRLCTIIGTCSSNEQVRLELLKRAEDQQSCIQKLQMKGESSLVSFELEGNGNLVKLSIVEFMQVMSQSSQKQQQQQQQQQQDTEQDEDVESIVLLQLPEGWNQGKFIVNINRCHNCEKHAHTTRHQEQDFMDKANLLMNNLKEVFPNIEILENKDKLTRLENFDVYIRGIGSKQSLDQQGRNYIYQKNEQMKPFLANFDVSCQNMYQQIAELISLYETTHKMAIEQDKFIKQMQAKKHSTSSSYKK